MKRVDFSSRARATADVLREEILRTNTPGTFLGSEQSLLDRLGVGQTVLRQASRILEAEHLVEVRRGAAGGLYTRQPSTEFVTHALAIYLRSQAITFQDLNHAQGAVMIATSRLAAKNPDRTARSALLELIATNSRDGGHPFASARTRRMFSELLCMLAGTVALRAFMETIYETSQWAGPHVFTSDEFMQLMTERYTLIAQCVARGDPRGAAQAATEFYETIEDRYSEETNVSINAEDFAVYS